MTLTLKNGATIFVPYRQYWDCIFGSFFYVPIACATCNDPTNELADISVGDPWNLKVPSQIKKINSIVARTALGESLLLSAAKSKRIKLLVTDCKTIKRTQASNLAFKKKALKKRAELLQKFGETTPTANPEPALQEDSVSNILPLLSIYLSSKRSFQNILKYTPYPLMQVYFKGAAAVALSGQKRFTCE
jgi:coenzyme F420-reducing hydrogenase beta subunit